MKSFNVIWWDFNKKEPEPYDIIPALVDAYKRATDKPKTSEEFWNFVRAESMYRWWSKCEYEIVIKDWPCEKYHQKWDIHKQVMMNIDIIVEILMEEVNKLSKK